MVNRVIRLCIACCVVSALTACGPKNNGDNNGTNNETTNAATNTGTNSDPNSDTNNNTPTNGDTTGNGGTQCSQAGEDCVVGEETNMGFVCVEDVCRTECDPNAMTTECQAGSVCIPVSEGGPSYCQPSECTGWLDDTSCEAGTKCVAFQNDAYLCVTAGTGAEGDACEEANACGAGLICAFGECQPLCGANADCDETGGERCIGASDGAFLDTNVGICEVGCDSYSFGQCPDGQGCYPVTSDDGICDDAGDTERYQACSEQADCGEGTSCVTFQSEDAGNSIPQVGRCLPFCDPTLDTQAASNATCPGGGAADMAWGRFVHLAEEGGMVDVYVDDTLVVDDLAFDTVSDAGSFIELSTGDHTVDITAFDAADNSSPIYSTTETVAGNDALTWGIIPDDAETLNLIAVDVPRNEAAPAAFSSKVRAVHAIPDFGGNIDVVAVPAGAPDFNSEIEIALDVAFGEAGSSFAEIPAEDWDIYIFPAGAARETTNANGVTVSGVSIDADLTFSFYARGTLDDGDGATEGLTTVDYASAPSAGGLPGFCLDLSGGEPTPNSGVCVEQCPDSDAYGTGVCSGPSDYCVPQGTRDTHLCFPGGPNAPGEACNPDDITDGCNGLGTCTPYGDGTGVCSAHCQPIDETNSALGCSGDDVCRQVGDDDLNIGICSLECTPDASFADTTACPENLQTCQPIDAGEDTYCGASGPVAVGDACSPASYSTCMPGDSCVNPFGRRLEGDDPFADGTCADSCEAFGDGSACGGSEVCALNWLTLNRAVGYCTEPDVDAGGCQEDFQICGQHSVCLTLQSGISCVEMCDLDNDQCMSGTCSQLFGSTQIRIGGCM